MSKLVVRVRMEPELERIAGNFSVSARLALAKKFYRWAHQLRVSARILQADLLPNRRRPLLKPLKQRRLALN